MASIPSPLKRAFSSKDSLTTVVFGADVLLERGLRDLHSQRIIVVSTPGVMDIPQIKDFYKALEHGVLAVFDQVSPLAS